MFNIGLCSIAYIADFVARKATRFVKFGANKKQFVCNECITSLHCSKEEDADFEALKLLRMRTKGSLIEPSRNLFELISSLERATLNALNTSAINADTIFEITKALDEIDTIS